jgi:hypothetical protein
MMTEKKATKEEERVIRMLITHSEHNDGFLQMNISEVRTLLDMLGVQWRDTVSTKDIPSPGMAHASIHSPWKLEQEAEGYYAQAEHTREQMAVLDRMRFCVDKEAPIMLDCSENEAIVSLIEEYQETIVKLTRLETRTYEDVEVKTIGQLLDELMIENLKIWHLVDKAHQGDESVQKDIQDHNDIRRGLVRAIDRRLGERDIGGRV